MERLLFVLGALFAGAAVGAGAFGAHGLRGRLTPDLLDIFETAVRYQMYHALALLAVALGALRWPGGLLPLAGWLFVAGMVIFSGSLYVLSLSGIRWLGAITPIGGVLLIVGWLVAAWAVWTAKG